MFEKIAENAITSPTKFLQLVHRKCIVCALCNMSPIRMFEQPRATPLPEQRRRRNLPGLATESRSTPGNTKL